MLRLHRRKDHLETTRAQAMRERAAAGGGSRAELERERDDRPDRPRLFPRLHLPASKERKNKLSSIALRTRHALRNGVVGVAATTMAVGAGLGINAAQNADPTPAHVPGAYQGMISRQCAGTNTIELKSGAKIHIDLENAQARIVRLADDPSSPARTEALCELQLQLNPQIEQRTQDYQRLEKDLAQAEGREKFFQRDLHLGTSGEVKRLQGERADAAEWLTKARGEMAETHVLFRAETFASRGGDPEKAGARVQALDAEIAGAEKKGEDWGGAFRSLLEESAAIHANALAQGSEMGVAEQDAYDLDAIIDLFAGSDPGTAKLASVAKDQAENGGARVSKLKALDRDAARAIDRDVAAIVAGAKAYQADHPQGADDAVRSFVLKLGNGGVATAEISAKIDALYVSSDDYLTRHPDQLVARVYQELGFTEHQVQHAAARTAEAKGMLADGKSIQEIRQAEKNAIENSPENWMRFRNSDRDEVYMSQLTPNFKPSWCGPFSGAMAMVSLGVAPREFSTAEKIAALDGQGPNSGVPGNVSVIARSLEREGLHAASHEYEGVGEIRSALEQGKVVIANGAFPGSAGHFVTLLGVDGEGRYIVGDPYRANITRWDDAGLRGFIEYGSHPTEWASVWRTA